MLSLRFIENAPVAPERHVSRRAICERAPAPLRRADVPRTYIMAGVPFCWVSIHWHLFIGGVSQCVACVVSVCVFLLSLSARDCCS